MDNTTDNTSKADEASPATGNHHEGTKKPRKPKRKEAPQDRSFLFISVTLGLIFFTLLYFVYLSIESTQKVIYVTNPPPPPFLYPVKDLVRGYTVTMEESDQVEITYDFSAVAGDLKAIKELLKDWESVPLRTKDIGKPIYLEKESGLPFAPLISRIAFEDDVSIEMEFALRKQSSVVLTLHSNLNKWEKTGTGVFFVNNKWLWAQFRQGLQYNYELSKEMVDLSLPENTFTTITFGKKENSMLAWLPDDKKIAGTGFKTWPEDRRYYPGEGERDLWADSEVVPQNGFIGVLSGKPNAVVIKRIIIRGSVDKVWREDRSKARKSLEEYNQVPEKEDKPADSKVPKPPIDTKEK